MQITKVTIDNFKTVRETNLTLRPFTVLVGKNNTGKSNILEALRLYFGDVKATDNMFRNTAKEKAEQLWIEVEYLADTPEEIEDLPEKYKLPGNRYRVRFWPHPPQ